MIVKGDAPEADGLNKYLGRDGTGHRGYCVAIRHDGKQAFLQGLTEHPGRLLLVQERSPGHWPFFVCFWDEELPTTGWKRCGDRDDRGDRFKGGMLRIGITMRGFELTPRDIYVPRNMPRARKPSWRGRLRSWLDNLIAIVRRWFDD